MSARTTPACSGSSRGRKGSSMGTRALPLLLIAVLGQAASAQTVAIKAGKIITMDGPAISNGVILVKNGKIAAVGKGIAIPSGMKVIDASDRVVMPGLVAALTH